MRAFGLVLLSLLAACDCGKAQRAASRDAGTRAVATSPVGPNARVGVVFGTITLEEGAELPRWDLREIDRGPDSAPVPPECGPPRETDTLPVEGVGSPTRLTNILVSATGEQRKFAEALGRTRPIDRRLSIEQCRLQPKFVSATVGDTLVLENHSNVPFLPSVGPTQFLETLLPGQTRRIVLDHAALAWTRCTFSAACGRSDVIVIFHPVHTTSTATGDYVLEHVPADQDVQIHAWHPRFHDVEATTRVAVGQRVRVDFTLRPMSPTPPSSGGPAPETQPADAGSTP